ncbi:MAG: MFS transporter [Chitinophagaceae bacterium]|nr:MFS transporter [Chitinophagaceae bacterium]
MSITLAQAEKKNLPGYFWLLFFICFVSGALGGTVSTLMSVYLPVVIKDMQVAADPALHSSISAYINAVFIFGWALGGFSWGVVGDRIGRKKAVLLSVACYGIFTVLTGLMQLWWGIVACRFFSGFGVGGVLVSGLTLISEVWPQRSRAIFIGILSIAFPVGIFSAGLITYTVPGWRQAFVAVGLVPLAISFAGVWQVRESETWLSNRDTFRQGFQKRESLFSAGQGRELLKGSLIFGSMLIGLWAIFSWLPTWVQSLITTTDGQKERGLSMMLLGMGGLAGGFFSGWLLNAIGLRRSMLLCFAVCSVLSFILFKTNGVFSPLIYVEIGILAFFFGISQGVLSSYIPQLFSTGIRASATGFCFNIGRLFTGTAVLFVGMLVTSLGGYGNAIYIFSLVFIIGLIIIFLIKNVERKEIVQRS